MNVIRVRTLILVILAGVGLAPAPARAVTLGFGSLPSAQGWAYDATGNTRTETQIFSLGTGKLTQNSIGVGYAAGGDNRYVLGGAVRDGGGTFELDVTASVLQSEKVNSNPNDFGFGFGLFAVDPLDGTKVEDIAIGLSATEASFVDGTVLGAASGSNAWALRGDLAAHTWTLSKNGVLFASGSARLLDASTVPLASREAIYFGDLTGGANAKADITALSFSQVSPVPEPGALALAALSALAVAALARRRAIG
ncbi:MAG TPA: hypothetical protein VHF22_00125 [Planctomycetota bacterium]|nr:hypothetical protein [Planctomycetota bacterium]